ncbi:unnamed protein product [Owenia fusiformis]|uniref:Cytochrome P450 n=1 Tax=Owenia fusiformis TaxID=6347 RepID=A0A8J1UWD7_OWEFU|nr:unnamed protein product [Owenia fusiformis]
MSSASNMMYECTAGLTQTMLALVTPMILPTILLLLAWKLWLVHTNMKDPNSDLPLPPGSMGVPFLGETFTFIMKGADFFRSRSDCYGTVYKTHILGKPTVRVTGSKNVAKILEGEGTIVQTEWPGSTKYLLGEGALAHSTGEQHRWRRETILKAFNKEALAGYLPSVQAVCNEYVKEWCKEGSVFGYAAARSLTFSVAAKMLLGFDFNDRNKMQMMLLFEDMLASLFSMPVDLPGIGYHKGLKARCAITEEIESCIQKRTASGGGKHNDALALILEATEGGNHMLTKAEISDSALELLFAGHLPAASAACSVLMLLGSNPKIINKVSVELFDHGLLGIEGEPELTLDILDKLEYVDCVVKEVLRIAPPVGAGYRKALQTFDIDGCQIPKGWTVVYSIRETHQSSELFKDGDTFDPDRWRTTLQNQNTKQVVQTDGDEHFNYVPFGWGDRSCVGQDFSKMMLKVLVVELVRNATWRLTNGTPEMVYMPVPYPKDNLPLQFREIPVGFRRRAFTNGW